MRRGGLVAGRILWDPLRAVQIQMAALPGIHLDIPYAVECPALRLSSAISLAAKIVFA